MLPHDERGDGTLLVPLLFWAASASAHDGTTWAEALEAHITQRAEALEAQTTQRAEALEAQNTHAG
jgi:hypothetical protein